MPFPARGNRALTQSRNRDRAAAVSGGLTALLLDTEKKNLFPCQARVKRDSYIFSDATQWTA
jgi:hypothetical protein